MPRPIEKAKNPATATKIPIKIRLGSNDKSGAQWFQGMENRFDKPQVIDVNMTWVEAFWIHFGVRVDPDQFIVQRQPVSPNVAIKHDLRENVKLLMGEFKMSKPSFVVHLLRKIARRSGSLRISAPLVQSPTATITVRPSTRDVVTKVKKNLQRTAQSIEILQNPSKRLKRDGENSSMEPNVPTISQMTNKTNDDRTFHQTVPQRSLLTSNDRSKTFVKRVGPPTASGSRACVLEDYMPHDVDEDVDNDFESNDSNDSLTDDLINSGIEFKDVKTNFCTKAKDHYSNTQFLQMRHELQQFKKSNVVAWNKWTTRAPVTANIFRGFFDL